MKVGVQIGLTDPDQIADYCRAAGVDEVAMSAGGISANIAALKEAISERGIHLTVLIPPNPSREAVLGENESEVVYLCEILRAISAAGVDTALFYPLDRFKNYLEEYHHEKPPLEVMPGDEKWGKIIEFFRRIADVAEEANLKIANHVFAVGIMRQILNEVKSPALGVTYCTGMYIFGEDPYTGVDIYGIERIFFCHARNLVRHGPGRQGHEEVPLDRGDINMARYVRVLVDSGYNGLIVPEHWGEMGNVVDSVVYLKRLINEALSK